MSGSNGRVLVVDDNEMNRDVLQRQLEREGYEVVTAAEGLEALELVDTQSFDLLLLDIMMPGLTGIELLKIVRAEHPAHELPVIMATARDKSENMVEALSLGANDYVTKPIDFPVLLARVQAHLKMKTAARTQGAAQPAVKSSAKLEEGQVLAGKYELESAIGTGAFGAVWRARHMTLGRSVAIKVLQNNMVPSKEALKRFQLEGISACRIQHPNAVSIVDFGVSDDGVAYLVMELLTGRSLADEIKASGALTPLRCAEILRPVCDVLAEAHAAGIIHRDIKPANVFLHRGRSGESVKVLDFGIAKLVDESADADALTMEGNLVGTPAYMAPERLGNRPYDGRSDVYSVGIMLYQMLCGSPPFHSSDVMAVAMMQMTQEPKPLGERNPAVPPAVAEVVHRALAKDPERRPTASQLAEGFLRALGLEVTVEGPAPAGPAVAPAARRDGSDPTIALTPEELEASAAPGDPPGDARAKSRPAGDGALGKLWSRLARR